YWLGLQPGACILDQRICQLNILAHLILTEILLIAKGDRLRLLFHFHAVDLLRNVRLGYCNVEIISLVGCHRGTGGRTACQQRRGTVRLPGLTSGSAWGEGARARRRPPPPNGTGATPPGLVMLRPRQHGMGGGGLPRRGRSRGRRWRRSG